MTSLDIHIPLTKNQTTIMKDPHRFKVIVCGRQFGKSHFGGGSVVAFCMSHNNAVAWVISPTYRQSGYLFDKVVTMCKDMGVPISVKKSNQEMIVTFTLTGSRFQALSGDDPDKLRGQTLDLLIIDEAAMLSDEIWTKHLRPMTAVMQSPVIFISTPKGKNWFYDIYKLGTTPNPLWVSYSYTSYEGIICERDTEDNHPGRDELDRIHAETDDLTWQQEYLAKFLDSGGVVFSHYSPRVLDLDYCPDDRQTTYFISIDLAKHGDYTVLFVADTETNEIVDYWRATGLSWESQVARFHEFDERYHSPRFFVDSTGLGDTIVERMIEEGLDAQGIVFSNKSKQQMVQNLAVMLQKEELRPPDVKDVLDELDRYQFEHTPSGQFRYSAPDGYHDDCVSSLMILAWALSKIPKDIGFVYEGPVEKTVETPMDWSSEMDKLDWNMDEYEVEL